MSYLKSTGQKQLFYYLSSVLCLSLSSPSVQAWGPRPPSTPVPSPGEPSPEPEARISHFSVVDLSTQEAIAGYEKLQPSQELRLDDYPGRELSVVAVPEGRFGSVGASFDGTSTGVRNAAPYWVLPEGAHLGTEVVQARPVKLRAEPFRFPYGVGERGEGLEQDFWVYPATSSAPPPENPGVPGTPPPESRRPTDDRLYPDQNGHKNVSQPIIIDRPGVYDFKRVLHRWRGAGSCDQGEGQPYILLITANNVTVKNFYYQGAPDGVHVRCHDNRDGCKGEIRNIVLENMRGHACEDALTVRRARNVHIKGGLFAENPDSRYRDKTMAMNSSKEVLIDGVYFKGGATCVRFKSGADIRVKDSVFDGCNHPFIGDTTDNSRHYDPPGREAWVRSEGSLYKGCRLAFRANDSKVRYASSDDVFHQCTQGPR
jgi:hypothetical protein